MMRRLAALAIPCIVVILAAGCGSTPSSRFYTLSATPAPAGTPSDISVAVGPVTIPAVIDRPQIVVSAGPNQVRLDEFNRWAAPLQSNISRVVADNLAAILGTSRVSLFPQTMSAAADYRVAIQVQSFDSAPGDAATLDAVWTVSRSKDGRSQTGRTALREASPSGGYDGVAAAHSRALARMSRDITDAIQALARSGQ
jgi:uncharacterized lipoprotein YmbA